MAYQPVPTEEEGGQNKVIQADWNAEDLLRQILTELRLIRTHMELINGEIKETDVQVGED